MNTERDRRLDEVVTAYLKAKEAGHTPDRNELLALHPDLADDLAAFFAAESQVNRAAAPLRADDTATVGLAGEPTGPGTRIEYFGDYHLLVEVGRGGMGVVYRARQESLNRTVALKMILTGQLANEADVKRFRAEAEAAARLDHPGIVPVFEVGQHDGHQYFSMAFVEGESLAHKLAQGLPSPREAAELTRRVAEAVAYAHVEGVVHRDLKPANILIDRNGQPRLTDFGLAKRVEGDSNLTQTGQIVGTPSYMPPEQASGRTSVVGPLSDVYSLGAILYCLLTGRPPFQAATPLDTLLQVLEKDPVSPRQLNSSVPRDLETVCLKCLEKEPRKRYASARELGADLDRYLTGQPILARPASPSERAIKWVRRRPAAAALVGVSAAAVLCLGALGIVAVGEANRRARAEGDRYNEALAREQAERERANVLDAQVAVARNHVYSSDAYLGGLALDKYSTLELANYLDSARPKAGEADVRGFEWYYLWLRNNSERLSLRKVNVVKPPDFGHDYERGRVGDRNQVAFSPDGRFLATTKDLCDAATGRVLIEFDEVPDCPVLFSPDGKVLFANWMLFDLSKLGDRGKEGVRIPRKAEERFVPLGFFGKQNAFAVAADWESGTYWDDRKNAVGNRPPVPHAVNSYDLAGKVTVHDFPLAAGRRILNAGFASPRGLMAVAIGSNPNVASPPTRKNPFEIWDLATGERKEMHIDIPTESSFVGIQGFALSPDGSLVAVVARDRTVRLCSTATGKEQAQLGHLGHPARYVSFSTDGKALVVGYNQGGPAPIMLYDVATGKKVGEVSGTGGFIGGMHNQVVRLSPDGKTIATANTANPGFPDRGGIALWDATTGRLRTTLLGHRHEVIDMAFSADGKSLASRDYFVDFPAGQVVHTSLIKVWDVGDSLNSPIGVGSGRDGPPIGLPVDTSPATAVAASPDGRTVAVGFANGMLHICDATSLRVQKIFGSANRAAVNALQFSADGKQLVLGRRGNERDNNVEIWDPVNGKVLQAFSGYLKYEFNSPYEKWKRSAWAGAVTDKVVVAPSRLPPTPGVQSVDYSITLWNVLANKTLQVLKADRHDNTLVALSPEAQILAMSVYRDRTVAGSVPRCITLRDVATGKERDLPGDFFGFEGYTLQFSPDGKYLALAGYFQVGAPQLPAGETPGVRLYDVAAGKELVFVKGHAHAGFSPDSKRLLTRSNEQVALWDTGTAKEIGRLDDPDNLVCDRAIFSPDGKSIATLTLAQFERQPYRDGKRVTDGTEVRITRMRPYSIGGSGSSPGGLISIQPVYEVHIWDAATRQRRNRFIVSWQWFVDELAFSADGRTIYTLTSHVPHTVGVPAANHVQAWDVATGRLLGRVGDNGTRYHALAYQPDGRLLAVTEQQNGVRVPSLYPPQHTLRTWDVARREEVAAPQVFTATELPVSLDPKAVALASSRRPGPDEWDNEFAFGYRWLHEPSADGKIVAVEKSPGIELIDQQTGQVLHLLKGNGAVTRLAFSPDGKTLAVGTGNGQIRLWNVAAGRLVLTIEAHAGSVNGLAFRADGRLLASCSESEIRYWRAATNEEVAGR